MTVSVIREMVSLEIPAPGTSAKWAAICAVVVPARQSPACQANLESTVIQTLPGRHVRPQTGKQVSSKPYLRIWVCGDDLAPLVPGPAYWQHFFLPVKKGRRWLCRSNGSFVRPLA
jgi:hypothetical protein